MPFNVGIPAVKKDNANRLAIVVGLFEEEEKKDKSSCQKLKTVLYLQICNSEFPSCILLKCRDPCRPELGSYYRR